MCDTGIAFPIFAILHDLCHWQIFTGFFKNVTRQINLTIRAKTTDLTQNLDWILSLLECYTILANNMQVKCYGFDMWHAISAYKIA